MLIKGSSRLLVAQRTQDASHPVGSATAHGTPAPPHPPHRPAPRCARCVQVSVSGQALVFVVRTFSHSFMVLAGGLTYVAFFLAQVR